MDDTITVPATRLDPDPGHIILKSLTLSRLAAAKRQGLRSPSLPKRLILLPKTLTTDPKPR